MGEGMCERMQDFTEGDLNKLHDASMEILRDVGVLFNEPDAVEIFRKHGVKVEGKIAFLNEKQVRKALETAPLRFTITARNPEKSVTVGDGNLVLAPGYGAPFVVTQNGEHRKATMDDYNQFCKLVDTSKYIDMNGFLMVEPSDVPSETAHLDMLLSNIVLCDKPFMGSPVSREAAIDAIEMAGIVWGGKARVKHKPVMISLINSLSPLQYSQEMAGALIEFARYGQPVMVAALAMAGSSGPVTIAGVLALQNAEILAGITLAQLVNPGVPMVYGSTSAPMDMRTGALSIGAPELSMGVSATAQMARFYGLPSRSGGALTDSQVPDIQAGIESTLALVAAARSGINFVLHSCGILGSYIAMSYEKFLIDEELCGMIRKSMEPIDLSDEGIDLDGIKGVGIGGEYLTHPKTLERCRTEFFLSALMNRQDYMGWTAAGKKRLDEAAADLLISRLAAYQKPEIDPEIEGALSRYVAQRKEGR
jgi:trimethylamine--corrinoid protein Co-methyltransferase